MNEQVPNTSPDSTSDDLIVSTDKRKTLGWAALLLLLAMLAGIFSLTVGRTESPLDETVNVVFTVGMLAVLAIFSLPKLFTTGPQLIVTHEGIRLGQHRLGLDLIPWPQITALTMIRVYGQAVLEIRVAHPEALLADLSERQRLLCLARHPQLGPAGIITLSGSTFAQPLGAVLVQIKRRFSIELEQYGVQVTIRR